MGKVEDMRRIREQRAAAVRAPAAAPARSTQVAPPARTAPSAAGPDAAGPAAVGGTVEGLCGHTSISGRSCTREKDHQKAGTKNHRYG